MEGASRTRLVALAVLLAISVPLVVIAAAGGGSGEDEAGLRVERAKGTPEIVVYLEDPELNEPGTNRDRPRVGIECRDAEGTVVFRGRERWPFSDTDGGVFDPHVHVRVEPAVLDTIASCRLEDTEPPLEGRRV